MEDASMLLFDSASGRATCVSRPLSHFSPSSCLVSHIPSFFHIIVASFLVDYPVAPLEYKAMKLVSFSFLAIGDKEILLTSDTPKVLDLLIVPILGES